jgi:hypothetical protein
VSLPGADVAFYTLAFLVPGFIMNLTLSLFSPHRVEDSEVSLLRFLTMSSVNYAVWSWLIYWVIRTDFFTQHPIRTAAIWCVLILLSPIGLALVFARVQQNDAIRRALRRMGFNPMHPSPTAWDYKFGSITEHIWVIVSLKDGSSVAGLYGSKSMTSSEEAERDIYLEEVHRASRHGKWKRISGSDGILIMGGEISHIEFRKDLEGEEQGIQ